MRGRKTLALVVGATQTLLAITSLVLACVLYLDFFNSQSLLSQTQESLNLYVFGLLTLSFLSVSSGLFLIVEWVESR